MSAVSVVSSPSGPQRLTSVRKELDAKVAELRTLLRSAAPHGFKTRLSERIGCRVDRLSREDSPANVEKLSLEYVDAAIALHTTEGRPALVQEIIHIATRNWPVRALAAGSVIHVFDEGGQLVMRFDR